MICNPRRGLLSRGFGWLVVFRIYVALAVFQPYRNLKAGDNQSLKFKWRGRESNPGPLAPQAKSLTNRPPLLHAKSWKLQMMDTRIGFPCPFHNVVIDYFSPTPFIFNK